MVLERFGRKRRLNDALRDLKEAIAGASLAFSTEVLDEYDTLGQKIKLESGDPQFKRIAVAKTSRGPVSHLNQIEMAIEGLCFFTHLISRSMFRTDSEILREAAFDPVVLASVELYVKMIAAMPGDGQPPSTDMILACIHAREEQYSAASRLLGEDTEGKTSVIGIAPAIIAAVADRPSNEALKAIIRLCLLRQMAAFDWKAMVAQAEANI